MQTEMKEKEGAEDCNSENVKSTPRLLFLEVCSVCGNPASKKCGGCSLAFYCSQQHQKADWIRHKADCRPYRIQVVEGVGKCLIALRWISAGTNIIAEYPITTFQECTDVSGKGLQRLLTFAKANFLSCSGCESGSISSQAFYPCSKCGIPLCSPSCESSEGHSEKYCKVLRNLGITEKRSSVEFASIYRDLTILAIIQAEKARGKQISYRNPKWGSLLKLMLHNKIASLSVDGSSGKQLISSLNLPENLPLSVASAGKGNSETVAMLHWLLKENSVSLCAKGRKRGIYEKFAFVSHSCCPNSEWWIDDNQHYHKLFVRVIKPIVPGERITVNRGDATLLCTPTLLRRQRILKELSFVCECERCADPSEKGTFLSGVRCNICKDSLSCNYHLPSNPLDKRTSFMCSGKNCKAIKPHEQVIVASLKAEKELEALSSQKVQQHQAEDAISRLQDFIIKHQRKILHPGHYLILMAKSRVNKIASWFLGTGEKMFLCVVTSQPRSYDYCSYKFEYLTSYLGFLSRLYDAQPERTTGKVLYEIGFAEAALVFQDFHHERMAGTTFFRRLHSCIETLNKCRDALLPYSDCKEKYEGTKTFGQMLRRLFGSDFLASYRLKYLETSDLTLRNTVSEAIAKWTKACDEIGLPKVYINPECNFGTGPITDEQLQRILMDIPAFDE